MSESTTPITPAEVVSSPGLDKSGAAMKQENDHHTVVDINMTSKEEEEEHEGRGDVEMTSDQLPMSTDMFIESLTGMTSPPPQQQQQHIPLSPDNDDNSIKINNNSNNRNDTNLLSPSVSGQKRLLASAVVIPVKKYKPSSERSPSRSSSPSPLPSPTPSSVDDEVPQLGSTGTEIRSTHMNRVEGQKNRFVFSDKHNQILETAFHISNSAVNVKVELAQRIGCTELQVANWFSRRRQREKDNATTPGSVSKKLESLEQTPIRTPNGLGTNIPSECLNAIRCPREDSPQLGSRIVTSNTKTAKQEVDAIPGSLKSSEIQRKILQLVQGGAIAGLDKVKAFITLMNSARDNEGRRSCLNALLMTVRGRTPKAAEIVKRFVKESGGLALRKWIEAGRDDYKLPGTKNMLLTTIEMAKSLPFDLESLKECKLGVAVRQLAKDEEADQEIRDSAHALEMQWRQLVSSSFETPKSTEIAVRDKTTKRTVDSMRDAPFEALDTPLPKFVKGKSIATVEATKKPQIRENASFFKDLGSVPLRTNTSPANLNSSSTLPVSSPTTPTTPVVVTPSSPSTTSPSKSSSNSCSSSSSSNTNSGTELVGSIIASAAALQKATTNSPPPAYSLLPLMPVAESVEVTPVSEQQQQEQQLPEVPVKPKKTVRFKNADELVAIRYIDPRPRPGETEEESSEDEDEDEYQTGQDEDEGMFHVVRGHGGSSIMPVFMMTAARLEPLVRGDNWTPPLELYLEPEHQVRWGERSTETEAQEKRENETLSATYFQLQYIPPSPAEPDPDPVPLDPSPVKQIALDDGTTDHSNLLLNSLSMLQQMVGSGTTTTAATALPSPAAAVPTTYGTYQGYGQGYGGYSDLSQFLQQPQPQQQQQPQQSYSSASYANMYAAYASQTPQETPYTAPVQQVAESAPASVSTTTTAFPDAQTTLALLQMLQQHSTNQQPQAQQQQQQQYQQTYQQLQQGQHQQASYGQNAAYPYYYQNNQPPSS
ncbi:hypothetical protein BGZ83_006352 [Gryganskiella cystojenkinii]|nr:hypothetical protein BGZ83_006352 [Gryganskiella cystojenkinii]